MSEIRGLVKTYGDFQLRIPEMNLPDEGVTCLLGPSGSGKSTVFRILTGIESCPGLSWIHKGVDLATLSLRDRRLGVVFQNYEVFPHMTAEDNLRFAAKARGLSDSKPIEGLMEALELRACRNTLGGALSGGEAQRVAIGRALVGEPQFLLLDEPFSSLDVPLRKRAREVLLELIEKHKVPTLLITHDPDDVQEMADHEIHIEKGQLV